jgi:hypothetical protein
VIDSLQVFATNILLLGILFAILYLGRKVEQVADVVHWLIVRETKSQPSSQSAPAAPADPQR